MTMAHRVAYNFAVLRAVPHVATGAFTNIGVVVHARTEEYLALRALRDAEVLRARVPDVDIELLGRYLDAYDAIARGDPAAGPVACIPPSERFHWLTSPRSDVIQPSPVHEGICDDPAEALAELFDRYVMPGAESGRSGS